MSKSLKSNDKIEQNDAVIAYDTESKDLYQFGDESVISTIPTADDERKQAIRAKRIANLKPLSKGTVLNPSGKNGWTTGKNAMIELAMSAQHKAMKVLIKQLDSPDERIAQQASRELLDRAFGKAVSPVATVDSKGDDVPPAPPMIVVGVQCK